MHQLPPPIDVTRVPNMWMSGASLICFVITPRVLSLYLYVNTGWSCQEKCSLKTPSYWNPVI